MCGGGGGGRYMFGDTKCLLGWVWATDRNLGHEVICISYRKDIEERSRKSIAKIYVAECAKTAK